MRSRIRSRWRSQNGRRNFRERPGGKQIRFGGLVLFWLKIIFTAIDKIFIAGQRREPDAALFQLLLQRRPVLVQMRKIAALQNRLRLHAVAALAQFQRQLRARAGLDHHLQRNHCPNRSSALRATRPCPARVPMRARENQRWRPRQPNQPHRLRDFNRGIRRWKNSPRWLPASGRRAAKLLRKHFREAANYSHARRKRRHPAKFSQPDCQFCLCFPFFSSAPLV